MSEKDFGIPENDHHLRTRYEQLLAENARFRQLLLEHGIQFEEEIEHRQEEPFQQPPDEDAVAIANLNADTHIVTRHSPLGDRASLFMSYFSGERMCMHANGVAKTEKSDTVPTARTNGCQEYAANQRSSVLNVRTLNIFHTTKSQYLSICPARVFWAYILCFLMTLAGFLSLTLTKQVGGTIYVQ